MKNRNRASRAIFAVTETLEIRRFLSADHVVCPGGDLHTEEAAFAMSPRLGSPTKIDKGAAGQPELFQIGGRWSSTAHGGTGTTGTGITLTYSIVPDGTFLTSGNGEPNTPSDLKARLNAIYAGDEAEWLPLIQSVFTSWGVMSGITFIYEPVDTGTTMSNGAPGVLGVRGDIRIGAHPVDGAFNVLAYNYFPNFGDMTLDSNDLSPGGYMFNTASGSRLLRNVTAHELGHGLGFSHVDPINQTKLMEAFASGSFDGPQFDDMLAVQRNYGDFFEKAGGNNTAATATDRGVVGNGTNVITNAATSVTADQDWYKFTFDSSKLLNITLSPSTVPAYLQGPQNGATSLFNPNQQANLQFELRASNGTTILHTASSAAIGLNEVLTNYNVAAGTYYIRVSNTSGTNIQSYNLTTQVAAGGITGAFTPVSPDPRATTVDSVTITFQEPVTGFDITDLTLDRDGDSISLAGATLSTSDNQTWTLANLASLTDRVGLFTLAFIPGPTGITGTISGDPFAAGNVESWQMTGLNGTAGNDVIKIVRNGTNTDVYLNSGGSPLYSYVTANVTASLTVTGGTGDDTFTVDYAAGGGSPLSSGGASFDGGANSDSIIIIGQTGADTFNVGPTNVTRVTPSGVPITFTNNEGLDFTNGTYTFTGDVGAAIAVRMAPNTTAFFNSTQHLRSLVIENGAVVNFSADGNRRIVTQGLTLVGNGMLDMFDNDLILDYTGASQLATIENAVRLARNGGAWDVFAGITSTSVRQSPQPNKNLGVMEASDWKSVYGNVALFDNEVIDATTVLLKFTYNGDTDFNGKVDGADYAKLDSKFNGQSTTGNIGGWFNGDFNYDGKIDGADFSLTDFAFNSQGSVVLRGGASVPPKTGLTTTGKKAGIAGRRA